MNVSRVFRHSSPRRRGFQLAGTVPDPPAPPGENVYLLLDDFDDNRVVQPTVSEGTKYRHIWNIVPYSSGGDTITVPSVEETFLGGDCLQSDWNMNLSTSPQNFCDWQLYFYTFTYLTTPWTEYGYNGAHFSGEMLDTDPFTFPHPDWCTPWNSGQYLHQVNRFEFWFKAPEGIVDKFPNYNFNWGTFCRNAFSSSGKSEQDYTNWHFYHDFNLIHQEGVWQKCIVDTHPQHQREADVGQAPDPGNIHNLGDVPPTAVGNLVRLAGENDGFTYFDLITDHYYHYPRWDRFNEVEAWPEGTESMFIARPRFYVEVADEDVDNIASVSGCYKPDTNGFHIEWRCPFGEEDALYDVVYSYNDLHTNGFASGTAPAGGTGIAIPLPGVYQGVKYDTTSINITGHTNVPIYFGIRKQGETLFRQIELFTGFMD